MSVRIALCSLFCLLALGVSSLTAASGPSFTSPDAIKDQIDALMPELQNRDLAAVQKLHEALAPPEKVESQMSIWRGQLKADPDFQPIEGGWKFLGTRKLGSLYRQLVYVCRFDRGVFVWRFTLVEEDGRWFVSGVNYNGKFEDILEDTLTPDKQCLQVSDKIAGMVAEGDKNLTAAIKDGFVPHEPARDREIEGIARKLSAYSAIFGSPLKWERLDSRETEGILAENRYLIQWKQGTMILKLSFYRDRDEWKLNGINTGALDDSILAQSKWESSPRLASKPKPRTLK